MIYTVSIIILLALNRCNRTNKTYAQNSHCLFNNNLLLRHLLQRIILQYHNSLIHNLHILQAFILSILELCQKHHLQGFHRLNHTRSLIRLRANLRFNLNKNINKMMIYYNSHQINIT